MQYTETEFETLYTQCFPPSMRLAYSLLHEEDEARDVVQDVFLRIWQSDIRIDNPSAFIIKSVRNACITRLDRLSAHEKAHRRLMIDAPPYDEDDSYLEQRHREVREAVQNLLTPRQQVFVEKIYGDGLSYKETAEDLNVSVSAVNKNIVTALKKLRSYFKNATHD